MIMYKTYNAAGNGLYRNFNQYVKRIVKDDAIVTERKIYAKNGSFWMLEIAIWTL